MVFGALIGVPAVVGVGLCVAGRSAGDRPSGRVGRCRSHVGRRGDGGGDPAELVGAVHRRRRPRAAIDPLSALIVPTVAAIALLVLVFAAADRGGDVPIAPARFFGLMLIFVAAVLVTATATTLPTVLFSWELMGATSYALIGFRWRDPQRMRGGATAFLVTRAADLGLYLAAGAALAGGTMDLAGLASIDDPWRHVVAAGVLVAGLGKAAQLPFSFWLSRAMLGPSPVSALLHSAAMVAMGGYLLLRMSPLLAATGWAATAAAWVGAVTAVVLGAIAVAQRDLKQLLAASTAAQLGFVVLAAGVSATLGGATHLVAHAATKALLFLCAGAWLSALGTKQISALRGAARRWPVVGAVATVGVLALAGVAPLSLWATKDQILAAVTERSAALAVVTVAAAALSAGYAGVLLSMLWAEVPADAEAGYDEEETGTREISVPAQSVLIPLALAAATLGLPALPPLDGRVAAALNPRGGSLVTPGPVELILSALLAVAVLAAVVWWGVPRPRWAAGWLGLQSAADGLVVRPFSRLADRLARFDDAVIDRGVMAVARGVLPIARRLSALDDHLDGGVRGTAIGTLAAARAADRFDRSGIDGGVQRIAAAVLLAGRRARLPQTGLVHQYYVQIVAALVLAAVLLMVVR